MLSVVDPKRLGQDGESEHLLVSGHQWHSVREAQDLVGSDTDRLVNVSFCNLGLKIAQK